MSQEITEKSLRQVAELSGGTLKLDANETIALAKDLEHRKAQSYDVIYANNKEMMFVDIDTSAPEGAETISYQQWDMAGMAKVITNYADDLPSVATFMKEFSSPVKTVGAQYDYSIADLMRSAQSGASLPERKSRIARRVVENQVVKMLSEGHDQVKGLINHPNIPVTTLPNTGVWSGLTADQMLENLHFLADQIETTTKETFLANRLLMAPRPFNTIRSTPVDSTNRTMVLQQFQADRGIRAEKWHRLEGAGAGAIDRVLMYNDSPEVITFNLPLPYRELPTQAKGLALITPVLARVGALEVHYPLAMTYADMATS